MADGGRDGPGSRKNSSSSALDSHFVPLTSFGLTSTLGSSVRKRM